MIRINLLEVQRKRKARAFPLPVILLVLMTFITLVVTGYMFYLLNTEIKQLTLRKQENEKRLAELRERIKELENYEALIRQFEERQKVLEQLRRNQTIPVKVLDTISKLLPDNVWLDELVIQGGGINLKGSAFTNTEVVRYVNKLKENALFVNVYLKETKSKEIKTGIGNETISVYNFQIQIGIML